MILASKGEGVNHQYMLVMKDSEFERAVAGETIKKPTACRSVSGTWEVRFVKNSEERHKKMI